MLKQEFARPGVDPLWLNSWKKDFKNLDIWKQNNLLDDRAALERYVQTGTVKNVPSSTPSVRPYWSSGTVEFPLNILGLIYIFEFEKLGMAGSDIDTSLALRAVAAIHTVSWIEAWTLRDRLPHSCVVRHENILFTALGVIIGCIEESMSLARCQIMMFRRGLYVTPYPLFDFILRILGDYLGDPPIQLRGRSLQDPIFNELFKNWRTPDPEVLIPSCLAACDYHTWACSTPPRGKERNEFQQRIFTRFPVEILLVFKLRALLGFINPKLEHPLMNSPLGVLPEEIKFELLAELEDDLVYRVRQRMQDDGYNERALFDEICGK